MIKTSFILGTMLIAAAVGRAGKGRAAAAELKPGDTAPNFKLPGSDGQTYELAKILKGRAVVLAWFPMAFTPG